MKKNITILILLMGLFALTFAFYQKNKSENDNIFIDSDPVFVLSYNVCFNSMTHNGKTGSAAELGAKCNWEPNHSGITICARNIANMVDGLLSQYNISEIDFIGLQEASNWPALQQAASQTLAKMPAIITKQEREYAVTLYNPNKYTVKDTMSGDLDSGRPFQITIFNEGVIFINLHNDHGRRFSYDYISEHLSEKLVERLDKASIKAIKDYRIIAVGDFNQILKYETARAFKPFKDANITTEVVLANKPPITCCDVDGDMPWYGYLVGDLIFDSRNEAMPEVPLNYDNTQLQSDHLPVVSKLK